MSVLRFDVLVCLDKCEQHEHNVSESDESDDDERTSENRRLFVDSAVDRIDRAAPK